MAISAPLVPRMRGSPIIGHVSRQSRHRLDRIDVGCNIATAAHGAALRHDHRALELGVNDLVAAAAVHLSQSDLMGIETVAQLAGRGLKIGFIGLGIRAPACVGKPAKTRALLCLLQPDS